MINNNNEFEEIIKKGRYKKKECISWKNTRKAFKEYIRNLYETYQIDDYEYMELMEESDKIISSAKRYSEYKKHREKKNSRELNGSTSTRHRTEK